MNTKNKFFVKKDSIYLNNFFLHFVKNFQFFIFLFSIIISFIIVFFLWFNTVDYAVLYNNLSDKDGSWIIARLKKMKVPYKFNNISGELLVPENKLQELHYNLFDNTFNKDKIFSFKSLDKGGFNISQFNEKINYNRGLEGELSKTLMNIYPIKSARVHLVCKNDTNFLQDKQTPSASVVLTLYPDKILKINQINAITSIISSSVSGLNSNHIAIIDQNGNLLNQFYLHKKKFFNNNAQLYINMLTEHYRNKIKKTLEPLLGKKNFFVNITPQFIPYKSKKVVLSKKKINKKYKSNLLDLVPEYLNNLGIGNSYKNSKKYCNHSSSTLKNINNDLKKNKKILNKKNMYVNKNCKIKNKNFFSDTCLYDRKINNKIIQFSIMLLVNYKKNNFGNFVVLSKQDINNIKLLTKNIINFSGVNGDKINIINTIFFNSQNNNHNYDILYFKSLLFFYRFYFFYFFIFISLFFLLRKIFLFFLNYNKNMINSMNEKNIDKKKNSFFSKTKNTLKLYSSKYCFNKKKFFNKNNILNINPNIIATIIKEWMKK